MTALLVEARRPIDRPADDGFEVSYVAGDGAEHRVPLAHVSCPGESCDIRTYVATDVATSRLRLRVAARVWVVGSEQFCSAPHDVDGAGRESLA